MGTRPALRWSPEQSVGRLRRPFPDHVCLVCPQVSYEHIPAPFGVRRVPPPPASART
ncbi:hypothetical protein ACIGO6_33310 [Streptomyces sp. NPDC053750]|uniref:hypothetical protein n=1 Tax=Streptomyces sp. NPDC053750 TaxID=3365714 RepID=UPI0037D2B9BB